MAENDSSVHRALRTRVILNRIFDFLPNTTETLQNFRLVCRPWRDSVFPIWRAQAAKRLVQDEELENPEKNIISLRRFLDEYETEKQETNFIHRNFTLISWTILESHFIHTVEEDDTNLNKRFWKLHGPKIKKLTLKKCTIPNSFSLLPLDFWMAVPNLEQLILLDCMISVDVNTKRYFLECNSEVCRAEHVDRKLDEANNKIEEINEELGKPENAQRQAELTAALEKLQTARRNLISQQQQARMWAQFFGIYLREVGQMEAEFTINSQVLSESPPQLKFLEIKNLEGRRRCVRVDWSETNNIFPKLEKLVVRQQDISTIKLTNASTLQRRLNEVNVLKYSDNIDVITCDDLLEIPTRALSLDCGYETERDDVETLLTRRPGGYEKLFLFRAPFGEPYPTFPCPEEFNLTELEIWGNMTRNLNFLTNIPNLKKLTWNTSCYDEETHAVRLHGMLGRRTYLLSSEDIVHNTDQLDDNFVHENMESIQLENGPLSLSSLQMLGKWLPNLTMFKVTVVEDDQLVQIGTQWPNLENLELAHGSSVTAGGILNAILTHDVFQRLNRFIWRGCPCYNGVWGEEESRVVNELRRRCREAAILPWKESEQEASGKTPVASEDCLRALFERALPGEEENVRIFTDAFLRIPVVE